MNFKKWIILFGYSSFYSFQSLIQSICSFSQFFKGLNYWITFNFYRFLKNQQLPGVYLIRKNADGVRKYFHQKKVIHSFINNQLFLTASNLLCFLQRHVLSVFTNGIQPCRHYIIFQKHVRKCFCPVKIMCIHIPVRTQRCFNDFRTSIQRWDDDFYKAWTTSFVR